MPTRAVFSKSKLSRTGSLKASLTFVGGITIVRLVANRNTINLCQKGFTCRIWTADISWNPDPHKATLTGTVEFLKKKKRLLQ